MKSEFSEKRIECHVLSRPARGEWIEIPCTVICVVGKAILAYQPDHVLTQYLRRAAFVRNTPASIPDARTLLEVLERVRHEGYACDNEEAEFGLTCYGRPLLDGAGRAYAAISISGPTTQMEARKEEHLERIREVVRDISRTIL